MFLAPGVPANLSTDDPLNQVRILISPTLENGLEDNVEVTKSIEKRPPESVRSEPTSYWPLPK